MKWSATVCIAVYMAVTKFQMYQPRVVFIYWNKINEMGGT
jgi:hypothetical protein